MIKRRYRYRGRNKNYSAPLFVAVSFGGLDVNYLAMRLCTSGAKDPDQDKMKAMGEKINETN